MMIMRARHPGGAAVLGLLLLGGGLAAAAPSSQERPAQQVQVELEIRRHGTADKPGAKTDEIMKALIGITDYRPAQVSFASGNHNYKLNLFLDTYRAPTEVLSCDVEIHEPAHHAVFKSSVRVHRGVRSTIGRVLAHDGQLWEVIATVR